jgi:polyisoprenoid-binding protein YceI
VHPRTTLPLALALLGCPKTPSESKGASEPVEQARDVDPPTPTHDDAIEPAPAAHEDADPPPPEALPGQEVLSVDREHSSVGFAVARATIGHIGHFARFSANLTLEQGQPVGLVITVRTGSVAADQHGLTEHLKSADFFDVERFPSATFTASRIVPLPADDEQGTHRVHGTMQLHGIERELDFAATFALERDRVIGSAALDISAKAFGIEYEGMAEELAEDRVALEIELAFPRVPAR